MKLEGIRVLDLSLFLPGPLLTQMMADHGAEVIKLEPINGGEPNRVIGAQRDGVTVFFANTHRNKQSVQLNLKTEEGLEAALRLAERMLAAAHRTCLVPKEAAAGLGQALEKMEETARHLQRAAGSRAAQSALEAMSELNTSAIAVNRAIQNLRGAGSAAGFEEMLEQLEQAAAQQSGLNTQTQQLFGQGRAQPGGIEQLAAQQRAIQQMLEGILQQLGTQEERVLGDLENVGQ